MTEGIVLLIEDDPNLRRVLTEQLLQNGWQVQSESSGRKGLECFATLKPDIVLLDIGLEDMDGLQVCKAIRALSSVPIILVTAADTYQIKITALELGGDDYLTKPFYLGELLARMRAVLRRTQRDMTPSPLVTLGPLTVNLTQREVFREGTLVNLTKTEFDLLYIFIQKIDQIVHYKELSTRIWDKDHSDVRALHVHVSNLRKKLEPSITGSRYLITIPGVGYKLRNNDNPS